MKVDLGECKPLNARISTRQCNINRERELYSCSKCAGLVNAQLVEFKEESMVTEAKPKRGNHYLCIVPGCTKVRVKGQMCMKHWRISQDAASKSANDVATTPAPFEPCDPALTMGATSTPVPFEDLTESMNDSHLKKLLPPEQNNVSTTLSILLPLPDSPPPPRTGVFLDLTDFPELHVWLQEMCADTDIPLAVIGLLEARRKDMFKMKAA